MPQNDHGLNSLPTCCHEKPPNIDKNRVETMAKLYLKAIMKLSGEAFVPYNITEIAGEGITIYMNIKFERVE